MAALFRPYFPSVGRGEAAALILPVQIQREDGGVPPSLLDDKIAALLETDGGLAFDPPRVVGKASLCEIAANRPLSFCDFPPRTQNAPTM